MLKYASPKTEYPLTPGNDIEEEDTYQEEKERQLSFVKDLNKYTSNGDSLAQIYQKLVEGEYSYLKSEFKEPKEELTEQAENSFIEAIEKAKRYPVYTFLPGGEKPYAVSYRNMLELETENMFDKIIDKMKEGKDGTFP